MTVRSETLAAHAAMLVRGRGLAIRVGRELRAADVVLRARIEATLSGMRSMRRLDALERSVRGLRRRVLGKVLLIMETELGALVQEEAAAAAELLGRPGRVPSVVTSTVMGRTLRTWIKGIERADVDRVMGEVRMGVTAGESTDVAVRRVFGTVRTRGRTGVLAVTGRQLGALARTATVHFFSQVRGSAAGAAGLDETYELSPGSVEHSGVCRALVGRTFVAGEGPYPPQHFNCKSVRVPVIEE